MAKVIRVGTEPVNEGERRVIQYLREQLPDTYTLFPNIELPSSPQSYDLDLIVVAPHAVYAVEIKDWGDQIYGDDRVWILRSDSDRPSPYPSIAHKARVLKGYLTKKGAIYNRLWVQGIVTLASHNVAIDIDSETRQWITTLDDVVNVISDKRRMPQMTIDPAYGYAIDVLRGSVRVRSARPRRIRDYELLETIREEDGLEEYRARHKYQSASKRFRARIRHVSAYLPADELVKLEAKIRRDYDAMERIGPHPNLVPVRDFFKEDEAYVEISDWSEAGTLAARLKQGALTWQEKRQIMEGLAAAVAAIHEKAIVHRDIQASNVLLTVGGVPQLMNFDRAYLPAQGTVWVAVNDDLVRSHLPPELIGADYDAGQCSDVYSLGVLFHELLVGRRPFACAREALQLGAMPELTEGERAGLPDGMETLLQAMCEPHMEKRLADGAEVAKRLAAVLNPQAMPTGEPPQLNIVYQPNDAIGGDYYVQRVLGHGSFSYVYKVINALSEETWAMKIFHTDVEVDRLKDEFARLRQLEHVHIARVHDVGRAATGQYFLLLEYVDGPALDQFTSRENRLGLELSVTVVQQLLTALWYIHEKGYVHRDIKPSNLLLGPNHVMKVIDFNVAANAADSSFTITGTSPYIPPDLHRTGWVTGSDLFATGVVLYELVLGEHPYENRAPRLDRQPKEPLTIDPTLSDDLAAILRKAVAPNASERYSTASEFHAALAALQGEYRRPQQGAPVLPMLPFDAEDKRQDVNQFLPRLLTLYSQAHRSNSGTRGYDQVARSTYVQTKLDHQLRGDIRSGRYRLVIITGNAGDGKTAFIQALEAEVRSSRIPVRDLPSGNGRSWSDSGCTFSTNWDGSQDEGQHSSDSVLRDFFSPFAGEQPQPESGIVRIVGINEGRLRDFLFAYAEEFRGLKEELERFFDSGEASYDWLLVVNLNWRSLVAGGESSVFEQQLNALLADQWWEPCRLCARARECYVKHNVDSLRDPDHGPAARSRLRYLFGAVHLRSAMHITMRDLKSALAYVLFRDRDCEEIHRFLDTADEGARLAQLYYNGLWECEVEGPQDRLVVQLAEVDPALTADPLLDRKLQNNSGSLNWLHFGNRPLDDHRLLATLRELAYLQDDEQERRRQLSRHHAMLRRKAYFELHTERWRSMVPYTALEPFQENLTTEDLRRHSGRQYLLEALSWAHGVKVTTVMPRGFYMRASSEPNPSVRSYRFFPAEEFELTVLEHLPWMKYIEYEPHHLLFRHVPSGAELRITLDVFEFLKRVGLGYTPTNNDRRGPYLNVELFENALSHKPYGHILLEKNRGDLFLARIAPEGKLHLERWVTSGR